MDADAVIALELHRLRQRRPELTGALLASRDGLLVASDLPATQAHHLAALAAASTGLGHRFADALHQGPLQEYVVRSAAGCVVTYPAGQYALLAVVTDQTADLDALRGDAYAVARWTGGIFDTHRAATGSPTPPPGSADPFAPLATRTPMATLPVQTRRQEAAPWRRPPI